MLVLSVFWCLLLNFNIVKLYQFVHDRDDDKGVAIMSRHRYPTEICRVFERTAVSKLHAALTSKEPDSNEPDKVNEDGNNAPDAPKEKQGGHKGGKSSEPSKSSTKKASDSAHIKQATLKTVLGEALGYGPALSEHIILDAGLVPSRKVSKDKKLDDDTIQVLVPAISKFEDWLQDVISGDKVPEGYILMQNQNLGKNYPLTETESSSQVITISRSAFSFT